MTELFDWQTLSNVLRHGQLEFPRLRVFKGGQCVPFWTYTRTGGAVTGPSFELLEPLLQAGATLSIRSVESFSTRLGAFVSELACTLNEQVSANVYASWGAEAGFRPHWDNHDVLILQLSGEKSWAMYGETVRSPVRGGHDHYADAPSEPQWCGTAAPGTMLFLPRGFWHSAAGLGRPSLHLTLGIHRKTGLGWMDWLTRRLAQHVEFRRDLSALSAEQLQARVDRLLQACAQEMSLEAARAYLAMPPPLHPDYQLLASRQPFREPEPQ